MYYKSQGYLHREEAVWEQGTTHGLHENMVDRMQASDAIYSV